MRRKTRIKHIWVIKENGFVCGKCKQVGELGDNINGPEQFYWNGDLEKIICKCGHKLTTKEELEDKLDINEIQQYGFWIRFISEHFIPCSECQDRLHTTFMKSGTWYINGNKMGVDLAIFGERCYFSFRWMMKTTYYTPCKACLKRLKYMIRTNELHIYNDTKPVIELWRKWDCID